MEETTPTTEVAKGGMSKTLIVVVLIVILVLAGGAYELTKSKSTTPAETAATAETSTPTTASEQVAPSAMEQKTVSAYKDGVYTVDGQYVSPGGQEEIGVSLTLKDGMITDAVVTPKATRPISVKMQGVFSENYKPLVVGKSIDEVTLDVVSGSSLTPKGFNDAVTKIKEQAKA